MCQTEINTEQTILLAAEELFLEKGFSATKTTEIAEAAGVNHAMLHYYFRSKEKLFNKVFEQKVQLLATSFLPILESECSFLDKIQSGIKAHFDFLVAHPKLPFFILREIVANKEKLKIAKHLTVPTLKPLLQLLTHEMEKEAKEGRIAPVKPIDLIINMISLNVFSLTACQIFFDSSAQIPLQNAGTFLENRKQTNVQMITTWLLDKQFNS
jgi:AcrR family transcriptional regulator